jgi:hypothetical protein
MTVMKSHWKDLRKSLRISKASRFLPFRFYHKFSFEIENIGE